EGRARPRRRVQAPHRPTRRLGDGAVRTGRGEHDRAARAPSHPRGHRDRWWNSNFRDSMRRAQALEAKGIEFVDAGTSGGIWGLTVGYCLMIGASTAAFRHCEPIFKTLAPPEGYAHVGPAGAGHYVKMVHNGIEYWMLDAYAEGYEILHASKDFKLKPCNIANLSNHGSVVRSWLNELAARAFEKDADLTTIKGFVEDSGEGRWTVEEAMHLDV